LKKGGNPWGPIGRFGWKHQGHSSPFSNLIADANLKHKNWGPIKAGLFDGNFDRFLEVSEKVRQTLDGLNWL
jgi:hypothetical protein